MPMPHKPKRISKLALPPFIIALGGLPALAESIRPRSALECSAIGYSR